LQLILGPFRDVELNEKFGPSWSTHWFEIKLKIPSEWKEKEVHFIWDSECEALLWTKDGHPIQAFVGSLGEDRRAEYIFPKNFKTGLSSTAH
jgi:alpha-mannosidase